jgi:hypothetical protein
MLNMKCGQYSLVKFSSFVFYLLRAKKVATFAPVSSFHVLIQIAISTIVASLYFPYFTLFRNQTSQCYQFQDALSTCADRFRSSCVDWNSVRYENCRLLIMWRLLCLYKRSLKCDLHMPLDYFCFPFKCWRRPFVWKYGVAHATRYQIIMTEP